TFGGTNADDAQSVQQTSDGGYILCGSTQSYGAGGSDAWLIKVDDKIVLKRQLPNGTIEIFQVGKHGWQFGNTAPNMWPQSWWSQFNYSQSPYPLAWLL